MSQVDYKEVINNSSLSDGSKKLYNSNLRSLTEILGDNFIDRMTEDKVINAVMAIEGKSQSTIYNYVKTLVKLYSLLGKSNDILRTKMMYLQGLVANSQRQNKLCKLEEVKIKTKAQLLQELKALQKDIHIPQIAVKFIINYLLIFYNTRNLDLDVILTDDKRVINKEDNYLFVRGKDVIYIRNNYKTSTTFGTKEHLIRTTAFVKAVKGLLANGRTLLLQNKEGNRLPRHSLGKMIQINTINQLGSNAIASIITTEALNENDVNSLEKVSSSRGTNYKTLLQSYTGKCESKE
jgi:hypothetical protein